MSREEVRRRGGEKRAPLTRVGKKDLRRGRGVPAGGRGGRGARPGAGSRGAREGRRGARVPRECGRGRGRVVRGARVGAAGRVRAAADAPTAAWRKKVALRVAHLESDEDLILGVDAVEDSLPSVPVLEVGRAAVLGEGRRRAPRVPGHLGQALAQPLALVERPGYRVVHALVVRILHPSGLALRPDDETSAARDVATARDGAVRGREGGEGASGRDAAGARRRGGQRARGARRPTGAGRSALPDTAAVFSRNARAEARADRRGRHPPESLAASAVSRCVREKPEVEPHARVHSRVTARRAMRTP